AEFLRELEEAIDTIDTSEQTTNEQEEEQTTPSEEKETIKELISEEENPLSSEEEPASNESKEPNTQKAPSPSEEMEGILNSGMDFLSGLMKMTTGKDSGLKDQKVEIDKETGEVVMRFKLPGK